MRYRVLDLLRGLNFISMVLYHLCWDLVYMGGYSWEWYKGWPGYLWQQSICWGFILLSGFCWPLGRKKWSRGLTVFLAGALVTAVTVVGMPEQRVVCGVLTLLGSCMLLLIPAEKGLKKIPAAAGIAGSLLLFIIFRDVNQGFLGFEGLRLAAIPQELYQNTVTAWAGFPGEGFWSTDYFSVIPWIFLFLAGYFLGRLLREQTEFLKRKEPGNNILEWIGRHTLMLYLLHQPVIYLILRAAGTV